VIDLKSRRIHIAGVVRQPHGAWIQQVARNLVDHVDGFLKGKRYLLHDRDPWFIGRAPPIASNTCSRSISSRSSLASARRLATLQELPIVW